MTDSLSWDPKAPGAFARSFRLGEWIPGPVSPLFEDWFLGRAEAAIHGVHARVAGIRGIEPYHVVVNGWYFSSLAFLPVTPRALARSLPGMLARLVRSPRRVAAAFPPVARFGVPLYEREWRTELLPRYLGAVERATAAVETLPVSELPLLVEQLIELAGEYFASIAVVAGYAYKAEYTFVAWHRRRLRGLGESHLTLLLGASGIPSGSAHDVESLDWISPPAGERPTTSVGHRRTELLERLRGSREAATARARATFRTDRERHAFDTRLEEVRRAAAVREEQIGHFTRPWPVFRRALQRMGSALADGGIIEAPGDVFELRLGELRTELEGLGEGGGASPSRAGALRDSVRARRTARADAAALHPPLFIGRIPAVIRRVIVEGRRDYGAADPTGALVFGMPASPGAVTGPARVIVDLADASRLQPGDILVTRATTPAWTQLFEIAAGVVADVGSALSHASIVAREYGIPAVVGCGDATGRLRDGQTITLDGSAGLVVAPGAAGLDPR